MVDIVETPEIFFLFTYSLCPDFILNKNQPFVNKNSTNDTVFIKYVDLYVKIFSIGLKINEYIEHKQTKQTLHNVTVLCYIVFKEVMLYGSRIDFQKRPTTTN